MQNPYNNGRRTTSTPYQRLHDPTVPNHSQPDFPEPHLRNSGPSGRAYSYADGYAPSVGAQSSNHGDMGDYGYERGHEAGPEGPYMHGQDYQEGGAYGSEWPEPTPYHSQFPEYDYSAQNEATTPMNPVHGNNTLQVPWDANAVTQQSEASLTGGRRRRSSFAGSFKRYFDPESQSSAPLSRSHSVRQMFGLQRENTISEYADDEGPDYQLPISGDEYQLNTWAPSPTQTSGVGRQQSTRSRASRQRGFRRGPSYRRSPGGQSHNDGDISQGFDGEHLEPWDEEEEKQEDEYDPYTGDDGYVDGGEYGDGEAYEDGEGEGDYDEGTGEFDEEGRALQTIELFRGNLVLDCPVSTQLLDQYPEHRPVREFTHMRYTAATCDPVDFVNDQYTLRQTCYTQPRETELFICVTIYNEDDVLLARTLQGVFNNIRHLCHRNRSSVWGTDAWKKVVVCVVADGRDKLHPRAKALMAALGAYQEGFAKNMVNDKSVEAHLYEYTSMVRIQSVSEKEGVKLTTEKATPVQLMFCMKEKNKKKINSHRWFFQAFGEVLKPKVCVLLDSGTRPGNHAIYHLWKSFHRDPRVAGACGEIAAMLGTGGAKVFNPLVASQNFEYKMSNILDKPSESMFGFITVLPGAFSAYRFDALQNGPDGKGPLEKYFKGEKLEGTGGVFQANMYLAEDRILCWELVSKRDANWLLRYVKSAKAHTDVPEKLSELILQRRRWLNGSFFAQIYSLSHAFSIWRSGHSIFRKLAFHIQFLYQMIALLYSWFSLANFFLVFHILAESVGDPSAHFAPGKILSIVLTWVYAACILTAFILSLGNRPQGTRRFYDMMVIFFALLMAYMVFVTIYVSVKGIQYAICANSGTFEAKLLWTNATFRDLIISLLCTYALYFVSSMLFLDPWHIFTSMFQYVLLSPAYVNIMNVYAFCNTHDISWGTKGDTAQKLDLGVARADEAGKIELELPTSTELVDKYYLEEVEVLSSLPPKEEPYKPTEADKRPDYYALVRSMNVLVWVLMNLALVAVVLNVGGFQNLFRKSGSTTGTASDGTTGSASSSSTASTAVRRFALREAQGTCQELVSNSTTESQIYMAVIFWSVAVMAAYRFLLSVAYLIVSMMRAF